MNFSRKSSITWKQKHWGDTRPVKPSAAFSGPVLFFPEKRVFFEGEGGRGGGEGSGTAVSSSPEQQLSLLTHHSLKISQIQSNPALRTPSYYRRFPLSLGKAFTFSLN